MSDLPLIFQTCRPRADVEAGTTKDEQFAADLAQVVNGTAPPEYSEPVVFFSHTYPTRGFKELLKAVCKRISGAGGEVASIIRLHTQFGGGKTHSLIGLTHAVQGMQGVHNVEEFVDPRLLPRTAVRVAALDGENTDPADGRTLEGDLRAYSLWGELAYQLGGADGYQRIQESDRKHVAPGTGTLRELFRGSPTLIMIDEISVYLRKVERAYPGASDQFTAFLQALISAVESSPQAALVFTLAVGKDLEAKDAYRDEHERAVSALAEAESVASRKATQLNPTEEDETADVLRRRLFEQVDTSAAKAVVSAYRQVWSVNGDVLPQSALTTETRDQFLRGYPLHPETLSVLTEKTSSLNTFHRTRGMLRLLARTVYVLWRDKPNDAFAIHPHHIDPGFGPIRDEIEVRLGQGEYAPALKSDVAAVPGDDPAVAQQLDVRHYPGRLPITSYVARTVFLNTLAYGESAKGISPDRLKFSLCSPTIEPSFVEQARIRFIEASFYLDDRPGSPMRFMVEPNLEQMVRKQMADIDAGDVRAELQERTRVLFGGSGQSFQLVPFPGGPYEVPDEVGDGRPLLVVLHFEAVTISSDPKGLPPEVADIYKYKGADQKYRDFRNNVVFVVADERLRENMKQKMRRRLALHELRKAERIRDFAEHQQRKVNEEYETLSLKIAEAILHCYRHLFYPSHLPMAGTNEPIAHTVVEVHHASDSPGNGQVHVARVLRDQKKLLGDGDQPDAPSYVRDQTPLKTKGEITTMALRNEFRRAPRLSILLSDGPLITCIREGIEGEVFIYREGEQVWGKGDPAATIQLSENAFVHTLADAKKKKLWPRAEPLKVSIKASPAQIEPGQQTELTVTVVGGSGPYSFGSSEASFCVQNTSQSVLQAKVQPTESTTYQVAVTDSRGKKETATVDVLVSAPDGEVKPPIKPPIKPPEPRPPAELTAEGPLAQALTQLWEKARKANVETLQRLIIKFYEAPATWKVHQAVATLKGVQAACSFEAELEAEGIEALRVEYQGGMQKAQGIRSFLEPQIRSATDHTFESTYSPVFAAGLSLAGLDAEQLTKNLTKYGAGEAYVEAHGAPPDSVAQNEGA